MTKVKKIWSNFLWSESIQNSLKHNIAIKCVQKLEFLFMPARLLGPARLLIYEIFPPGTINLQARLLSSTEYTPEIFLGGGPQKFWPSVLFYGTPTIDVLLHF